LTPCQDELNLIYTQLIVTFIEKAVCLGDFIPDLPNNAQKIIVKKYTGHFPEDII
jgi:hypothetical protein